jgi:hypothetical protein
MISKPTNQITLADLTALIANIPEGKTIEYKREMPTRQRDEQIKFLAAVSSLANTAGGDLLIGVDAQDGLPQSLTGVAFNNLDAEKLRLEQLLATCTEPRLPRVDIQPIDCGNGRHILIIRAHQSWIAPHRVTLNDKFYGRNSAGKFPLDVGELRNAFVLSSSTAERIRNFRTDRLIKVAAGQTPLPLHPGAAMIIHVVPFSTFAHGRTIDIVQAVANGHVMPLPPGRIGQDSNYMPNLDGFATFPSRPGEPTHAYAQLFRSGAVEGVTLLSKDERTGFSYLAGPVFENTIVASVKNYLMFIEDIDLGFPVYLFLSFCGMKDCMLRTRSQFGAAGYHGSGPLLEDVVALPEASLDSDTADPAPAMRLMFNTVWNAFGFPQSDKYDSQGTWIGTA